MFAGLVLWLLLLLVRWPLAVLALIIYPLLWLFLLPFRLFGFAVGGILNFVWSVATLPARIMRRKPGIEQRSAYVQEH